MKGTMNIEMIGENADDDIKHSGIERGLLNTGEYIDNELIVVGENEEYLHCFDIKTGSYFGVFKSNDKNHIYQHLLKLNTSPQ